MLEINVLKNLPSCFYTLKHEDVLDTVLIIIFTQNKNKIMSQNALRTIFLAVSIIE